MKDTPRGTVVGRALGLEYLTVGWNVVEGVIAVWAALTAGSVALLGFGIDSFIESLSGAVLIWRLRAETRDLETEAAERLDRTAHRLVALSLLALGLWVGFDATRALWLRERPEPSPVGIGLTVVSALTMWWLARAKRRAAASLCSRALEADAFQTSACFWLSIVTLAGTALNALLGWWWADPVAALGLCALIGWEALEAWRGEECSSC